MNIGNRFKKYRVRAGLKQIEAAEKIGVKNYQLGNYETNRSEPSIEILKKMSKVYGVSIDTLVGNIRMEQAPEVEELEDKYSADDVAQILNDFIKEFKEKL